MEKLQTQKLTSAVNKADTLKKYGSFRKIILFRKFHVATEIGSTFFGCWSVTGQLKK
jgi:hypothetical protein